MEPIRVLVVDDHRLVAQGLARLLADEPGITVVAVARDGEEALQLALRHRPDVILMDLFMPRWDGIEATRRICARLPRVRVIINGDGEDERHFVAAIRAGAYGYVTKEVGFDVLVKCVRSAARGEPAISRHHVKLLLSHLGAAAPNGVDRPACPLTARERDVLRLLIEGRTYRGIAGALYITEHTVRTHVQNMQEKLALPNRAQLIRYAVANRLFDVAGPEPRPVAIDEPAPIATPAPAALAAAAVEPKDAPQASRPGP